VGGRGVGVRFGNTGENAGEGEGVARDEEGVARDEEGVARDEEGGVEKLSLTVMVRLKGGVGNNGVNARVG